MQQLLSNAVANCCRGGNKLCSRIRTHRTLQCDKSMRHRESASCWLGLCDLLLPTTRTSVIAVEQGILDDDSRGGSADQERGLTRGGAVGAA